ncbi:MAG: LysR family transcriptional regulator [Flavobacteriales bacterium]|jgi:molybdate transport system regulatory protein|nr:LysR family transcriptional regulator [Flavobacteriales bacterium]MBK7941660.1 LysR family transcriptional regulator [Flavobacteriales bacterium]MBK8949316.1 LysR family transcriptional regulator [Flavobacteriales bacterium]MBK9700203.1 LysR family transcriptional regulator [Flavobacteriales bacterium]
MSIHKQVEVRSRIWITRKGRSYLGSGRVELLERIGETGSISEAARQLRISYKKAWEMVEAMNALAPRPLVERSTGGRGGGGTSLTAQGRRAVQGFRDLDERCKAYVDGLLHEIDL